MHACASVEIASVLHNASSPAPPAIHEASKHERGCRSSSTHLDQPLLIARHSRSSAAGAHPQPLHPTSISDARADGATRMEAKKHPHINLSQLSWPPTTPAPTPRSPTLQKQLEYYFSRRQLCGRDAHLKGLAGADDDSTLRQWVDLEHVLAFSRARAILDELPSTTDGEPAKKRAKTNIPKRSSHRSAGVELY